MTYREHLVRVSLHGRVLRLSCPLCCVCLEEVVPVTADRLLSAVLSFRDVHQATLDKIAKEIAERQEDADSARGR